MEEIQLKSLIEALLFASTDPISPSELKDLIEEGEKIISPSPLVGEGRGEGDSDPADQLKKAQEELEGKISVGDIKKCLGELMEEYRSPQRGFEMVEVAKGYQFRTKAEHASHVRAMQKMPKTRLSAPGMETLAILAYQQPITRTKIEEIRGVDSGGVLKTLLDRDLARIVGRSPEPGRPILYGTSQTFLETFGINSLSELPTLKDLEAMQVSREGLPTMEIRPPDEDPIINEESPERTDEEEEVSLDEESAGLVTELENSMRNLKDLEEMIFQEEEKKDDVS